MSEPKQTDPGTAPFDQSLNMVWQCLRHDRTCWLFRCRKEQGTRSKIMEMGDISRGSN